MSDNSRCPGNILTFTEHQIYTHSYAENMILPNILPLLDVASSAYVLPHTPWCILTPFISNSYWKPNTSYQNLHVLLWPGRIQHHASHPILHLPQGTEVQVPERHMKGQKYIHANETRNERTKAVQFAILHWFSSHI